MSWVDRKRLNLLPDVQRLREICRAVAMIEAIIMPDWQYRYFSYNSAWGDGEEMASMRNGSGSDHHGVFFELGAVFKGFLADSERAAEVEQSGSPPGWMFQEIPSAFESFLAEPAFSVSRTTFFIWRLKNDEAWNSTALGSNDELARMPFGYLHLLQDNPQVFHKWCQGYYERKFSLSAIGTLFQSVPLNDGLIKALNPDLAMSDLAEDILEMGYPSD